MKPTHCLESQGQALSVSLKYTVESHSQSQDPGNAMLSRLGNMQRYNIYSHSGETSTGIITRFELKQGMAATHCLKEQGWALSKSLKPNQTQHTAATHNLRSQDKAQSKLISLWGLAVAHKLRYLEQVSPEGLKLSKSLTNWAVKERCHEQAWNRVRHGSNHSLPREARIETIRWPKRHQDRVATHFLKSQEQLLSVCMKHN